MRKIAALPLLLILVVPVLAQSPSIQPAEMKKLDFLIGQWKGTGWFAMGPGQRRTYTQTESVQSKFDGKNWQKFMEMTLDKQK
ncbi:MAG TPA: hypothetical protein VNN73_22825 [Blastocatellia bacterium]|nr:hypothetical protein [Blastocatellia bacterium]